MKLGLTLILRGIVYIIGVLVIALCVILYPLISQISVLVVKSIAPGLGFLQYTFLIGLYATIIPFSLALYQTLKLLKYIDKNKAFSNLSVKSLKIIKYCAIMVSALYIIGCMPIVYILAELDDAPGLILIGLAISLFPTIIATFAAILQTLLQEAVDIKSENELTI